VNDKKKLFNLLSQSGSVFAPDLRVDDIHVFCPLSAGSPEILGVQEILESTSKVLEERGDSSISVV
jgi:hypothetical protein